MLKQRIAVLRGGPSDEYDVSMKTGSSVITSLKEGNFEPIDVIVSKKGEWLIDGFPRSPKDALSTVDGVFIALHGAYGEDGTVQRILESHGVPYTGSRSYPSTLAMNKLLAKEHLYDTPLKMAPHMRVTAGRNTNIPRLVATLIDMLGQHHVAKPVSGGSSLDVYITQGEAELRKALTGLLSKWDEVLVEQRIFGKEATCGVIERFRDREQYILPPIEIVPPAHEKFFSYDAKYSGATEEICPGRFSQEEKQAIEAYTSLIHNTLGLSQYSRSDFIVADDGIYFLEVNTLPGLASECIIPRALSSVGSSYNELVHHLVNDALSKRR